VNIQQIIGLSLFIRGLDIAGLQDGVNQILRLTLDLLLDIGGHPSSGLPKRSGRIIDPASASGPFWRHHFWTKPPFSLPLYRTDGGCQLPGSSSWISVSRPGSSKKKVLHGHFTIYKYKRVRRAWAEQHILSTSRNSNSERSSVMNQFLGSLLLVPYNFAPTGWALCQGQLLPIAQNIALFQLLGTTYGGDGIATFALPDLRGRVPISSGQGPGLQNYALAQAGGAESATLGVNQLPAHNHSVDTVSGPATSSHPANEYLASSTQGHVYASSKPNSTLNVNAITHVGGGQPVDLRSPYLTLNWIIALTGVFPSQG